MSKEIVYWKQKDGKLVSVDDIDTNHLKNAFKHLIKHHSNVVHQANDIVEKYNALVRKRKAERGKANFHLNGDMANEFHESYLSDEDDDRFDNNNN